MTRAVALGLGLLALPFVAQGQSGSELRGNPLAADLLFVVPQSRTSDSHAGSAVRSNGRSASNGWHRARLRFRQASSPRLSVPPRTYFSARQPRFLYFPHYARRSTIGLTNQPKPELAPMPVTYTPLADPFYEEKVIQELIRDALGYYP